VAYGFVAIGDLNSDGKADIVVSPISKSTTESIYGYLNNFTSGTLAASDFTTLTIPHSTTDAYYSTARNYHLSLADINWDGKMDIISAQLGGNISADHWIIENRASDMNSLSGSDFGAPIRINSRGPAMPSNWPYYRHTFAADFNRDSVPDLVSFHQAAIEFQTNTVAREPGVLEVTQLKNLDDTAHCSSSTGDTLLYKIYVKGLKANEENANLRIILPKYFRFKVTSDAITPPTVWSSIYTYNSTHNIATPTETRDTLFLWLLSGNLGGLWGSTSANLNTTRTTTDSVKIYFQKIQNSSYSCRSPEPVWTAPFTNTWFGRPTEVFSRNSNNHDWHVINCGHGDSLEFKFTSPDSDTLLYQVWVRNSAQYYNSWLNLNNEASNYSYADTMSGYYDIAVASGDTLRAPYDSVSNTYGAYTTYKAIVTDENGCKNFTVNYALRHRYQDHNNINSVSPSSVDAGELMTINMPYASWHWYGPGEQYDDSITVNDVNVGAYNDWGDRLNFTVPELPVDTVLGYNDTVKLYYHNPNPTEVWVSP